MGATENNELEYQIIETAKQLFIEKGFVETSMSDIAAKVGINRPTLHYYFRTKDRMFQEMEAGRLKKVPIHTIFITFYGLLTFPLITKNLITSIFLKDTTDFSVFMLEWKQYILFHLMNLLGIEKEN